MESGEHMPPTPPGMHHELMKEMFGFLGSAIPEGYNPEQDLRKPSLKPHPLRGNP